MRKLRSFLSIWHWRKKYLALLIILIAASVAFIFISSNRNRPNYKFAMVSKNTIKTIVSGSGVINGKEMATLKFQSGGKLGFIKVKAGEQISVNQTIAGLDMESLNISLQQAQNTYRDKQATVDKIIDDTKQYQYGNQTNSSAETFTLRQSRTSAEVARDNAYDFLKAAQKAFQDATITSPIAGTVVKTSGIPGQNISLTDTIAQVVDFSKIIFEADIDEADITNISLGQIADVVLNSYPDKVFTGTVVEIQPITKTTTSGATVITVKIDLSASGIQPIFGLNGQADVITEQKNDVLTIPQEALRSDKSVVIKTSSGYKSVTVQTGLASDNEVEITQGLNLGDEVITNPTPPGQPSSKPNPIRRLFGGSP